MCNKQTGKILAAQKDSLIKVLFLSSFVLSVALSMTPTASRAAIAKPDQGAIQIAAPQQPGLKAHRASEAHAAMKRGDYDQAHFILRLLAEQGDRDAQYDLGIMYYHGLDIEKDPVEAIRWHRIAAEQGHVEAQHNIGIAYSMGIGVSANAIEATKWYRKAALQGHTDAQYNLGLLYAQGEGMAKDMLEAAKWWYQAAVQGDAASQYALGLMFARGDGVAQNLNQAIKWWYLSASQGLERAQNSLKKLKTIIIAPQ